jgi:hypothetical protein
MGAPDTVDATATDALPADSSLTESSTAQEGGEAGPPLGCTSDPDVCPLEGVSDCTGWDCGDGGLTQLAGEQCVRAGEPSLVPNKTAYVCGPDVAGYIGDPAGNGCIRFGGNWCGEYGSPFIDDAGTREYEYACPLDGGPPVQSACIEIIPDQTYTGWCCNTRPTCSPWGGSPRCDDTSSLPQTYLGFGGATPVGCTPLADASSPVKQGVLFCCPVSTSGGPACQP